MNVKLLHVLVTVPLSEEEKALLTEAVSGLRLFHIPAKKAEDISAEIWQTCDVLYTAHVLPQPQEAPALKWIQFHYAGIDHALQAPILQKTGLLVTTMSGASASQMAEHVLTMLLALGHHLPAVLDSQHKKEWPPDRWERFMPKELRGSTVGIVGYGSIGRQVARLLQPFGATVVAAKHNAMEPRDYGYTPPGLGDPEGELPHRIYPWQAVRHMAQECDALVIAAPLTAETRGMINADVLRALRPGALIVDVSRGGILDHQALLKLLENGHIGGAALDVFPQEPLPPESPLWTHPRIIITPHISGNSQHYTRRAMELFAENLQRFQSGQPLYNLFDPQKGY